MVGGVSTNNLLIDRAAVEDAGEILTLQRAAYVTQAQLHGDPMLPPLTETLDELRAIVASVPAPPGHPDSAACPSPAASPDAPGSGRPNVDGTGHHDPAALGAPTLVLVARLDGGSRVVGSVRARVDGDTCHIGRLIVAPDVQGRGIGTALLAEIERRHTAQVAKFALFTGHLSVDNLRLYHRLGYAEVARRPISPTVTEVHLAKPA